MKLTMAMASMRATSVPRRGLAYAGLFPSSINKLRPKSNLAVDGVRFKIGSALWPNLVPGGDLITLTGLSSSRPLSSSSATPRTPSQKDSKVSNIGVDGSSNQNETLLEKSSRLRDQALSAAAQQLVISDASKKEGQRLVIGSKEFWDDALNIPNALTMTRIIATPGICWLIASDHYVPAIVTFWFAGFFDWVDGYLARKWNQMSVFGSFLDPLADKLFVGATLVTLTAKGIIPLWLGGLILGRDAGLLLGSFYVRYRTKPEGVGFFDMGSGSGVEAVEASMISKWNTLFQFGLLWFSMTHVAFNIPPVELMPAIWAISGISTFASGYDYWRRGNWDNIFGDKKTNDNK